MSNCLLMLGLDRLSILAVVFLVSCSLSSGRLSFRLGLSFGLGLNNLGLLWFGLCRLFSLLWWFLSGLICFSGSSVGGLGAFGFSWGGFCGWLLGFDFRGWRFFGRFVGLGGSALGRCSLGCGGFSFGWWLLGFLGRFFLDLVRCWLSFLDLCWGWIGGLRYWLWLLSLCLRFCLRGWFSLLSARWLFSCTGIGSRFSLRLWLFFLGWLGLGLGGSASILLGWFVFWSSGLFRHWLLYLRGLCGSRLWLGWWLLRGSWLGSICWRLLCFLWFCSLRLGLFGWLRLFWSSYGLGFGLGRRVSGRFDLSRSLCSLRLRGFFGCHRLFRLGFSVRRHWLLCLLLFLGLRLASSCGFLDHRCCFWLGLCSCVRRLLGCSRFFCCGGLRLCCLFWWFCLLGFHLSWFGLCRLLLCGGRFLCGWLCLDDGCR